MTYKIKRGVTAYSYNNVYGVSMDFDDIFKGYWGYGAIGIEILANLHIPSYPNVSEHWIENWHNKLAEYDLEPAEYVHWVDSRLYKGRELDT